MVLVAAVLLLACAGRLEPWPMVAKSNCTFRTGFDTLHDMIPYSVRAAAKRIGASVATQQLHKCADRPIGGRLIP
jgi:hypothetical protein